MLDLKGRTTSWSFAAPLFKTKLTAEKFFRESWASQTSALAAAQTPKNFLIIFVD